jgi:hypothetical protein
MVLCTRDDALGKDVLVLTSDSKTSTLAQKTSTTFSLDASYMSALHANATYASVKNIKLNLSNTKVLAVAVDEALKGAAKRSNTCKGAIALFERNGYKVSMIYSVLQADVQYTVEFRTDLDAGLQASIMQGLAADLDAKYVTNGTNTIAGTALFWGLIDNADMLIAPAAEAAPPGLSRAPGRSVTLPVAGKPERSETVRSLLPARTLAFARMPPPAAPASAPPGKP